MRFPAVASSVLLSFLTTTSIFGGEVALISDAHTALSGSKAGKPLGSAKYIDLSPNARGYLRFDLTSLPPGTSADQIHQANLWLFVEKLKIDGSFDVRAAGSEWTEAAVMGTTDPGFLVSAADTSAFETEDADERRFVVVDVTALVKAWLSGALPNHGFAILSNAVSPIEARITSREGKEAANRPRLEINFAIGGVEGPQGPQGLQGPQVRWGRRVCRVQRG